MASWICSSKHSFEHICCSDPWAPDLISRIYAHLTSPQTLAPPAYAFCWAADIDVLPEPENWAEIW